MEYDRVFDARAASYLSALQKYPHVLDREFACALDVCALRTGDVLVTIPSSCEQIRVGDGVTHIRFETSKALASLSSVQYCPFDAIPLPDATADVILCLASLHHSTEEERRAFYTEAHRILKSGGRLVIGDVRRGSNQDAWLNGFVNTYNSYGHAGCFFTEEDAGLLRRCGFTTSCLEKHYTWDFPSKGDMVAFCKELFHLDRASPEEVEKGLDLILETRASCFDWSLLYLVGSKP